MKTIMIDWDDRKSVKDEDIKKIIEQSSDSDFNIAIISSCVKQEDILNELRRIYPNGDSKFGSIKILYPDTLLDQASTKKALASDKINTLEKSNFIVGADKLNDLLFVSSNIQARVECKKMNIRVDGKLPEIKAPKVKDYSRPTRQDADRFPMSGSKLFRSSAGNTFGGKISTIDKVGGSKPSTWFAKEKSVDRMNLIQLEVFTGEMMRFLLGEQQPKTRYMVDEDKVFVLSRKIDGFTNFNSKDALHILEENKFKGLLPAIFVCMLIEEADLKADNIGLDSKGRVVKIDNDGSFASIALSIQNNMVPAYSNLRKDLISRFTFSDADIDTPHQPKSFSSPVWHVEGIFKNKDITSDGNTEDLYYLWAKMLSASDIIFHIMEKNIESTDLKSTLKQLLSNKIDNLKAILDNHPGYQEYMLKNGDAVMEKIKKEVQQFTQSDKKYFKEGGFEISELRNTFTIRPI